MVTDSPRCLSSCKDHSALKKKNKQEANPFPTPPSVQIMAGEASSTKAQPWKAQWLAQKASNDGSEARVADEKTDGSTTHGFKKGDAVVLDGDFDPPAVDGRAASGVVDGNNVMRGEGTTHGFKKGEEVVLDGNDQGAWPKGEMSGLL